MNSAVYCNKLYTVIYCIYIHPYPWTKSGQGIWGFLVWSCGFNKEKKIRAKAFCCCFIAALEHNGNSITNAFETMINPCHCVDFVWMHWKQDFAVVLLYWLQAVTLNAGLMSVTVSDNSIQNGLHGIKGFLNHIKGACNAILFQLEVLHIVMVLSFPWYVWMLSLTYYKINPLHKWLITKRIILAWTMAEF